jgi:hypothetical protein
MDTQSKNISAWTPVVAEVLHGFYSFEEQAVGLVPYAHADKADYLRSSVYSVSASNLPPRYRAVGTRCPG